MQAAPHQSSESVCTTFVDTIYRTLRWLVTREICLLRHLPVKLKSQRQNVRHVQNLKDWTLPWPLKDGAQVYFNLTWKDSEFSTHLQFPSMKLLPLLPLFAVQLKLEARQLHPGSLPSPLSSVALPQNLPTTQPQVALSPSLTFNSHSLQKSQFIPNIQCALKHNEYIIGAECPRRLWMDSVLLFSRLPKMSYCHAESKGSIFFNQLHKVDFTSIGF